MKEKRFAAITRSDFAKLKEDLQFLDNSLKTVLSEYRDYVTRIVPEERRPAVFFDNANRVYGLGL